MFIKESTAIEALILGELYLELAEFGSGFPCINKLLREREREVIPGAHNITSMEKDNEKCEVWKFIIV